LLPYKTHNEIKSMDTDKIQILLADDDRDDCFLFREALSELPHNTHLEIVNDGEELMNYLAEHDEDLPHVLFLDLNMPRKNGFECLSDIKHNEKLKSLPVVMFSTSYPRDMHYESDIMKLLYKIGAWDYIRKPENFNQLKEVISGIISRMEKEIVHPRSEKS
jgi:CheY-like chemotaxis protein